MFKKFQKTSYSKIFAINLMLLINLKQYVIKIYFIYHWLRSEISVTVENEFQIFTIYLCYPISDPNTIIQRKLDSDVLLRCVNHTTSDFPNVISNLIIRILSTTYVTPAIARQKQTPHNFHPRLRPAYHPHPLHLHP